jgi:isocitrate/isopropylmalate dehydrogenase
MRKKLGLFANVRPLPSLIDHSPLKENASKERI